MKKAILLAMLLANSAFADVATVVAIRGDVRANDLYIAQGDSVVENTKIETGNKSFVILQFFDGSKVTVRPSSEFIVNEYKEESVQLDLVSGGLRILTGTIAKQNPDNYQLNTPTALMGVRGTEFSVQIID